MMKRPHLTGFLLIAILGIGFGAGINGHSQTESESTVLSETIDVGRVEIQIPLPDGFARIDGMNPVLDEALSGFIPPSNELRLMAATIPDRDALAKGVEPRMARTLNVQILKKLMNQNVSERDFEKLRAEMAKEFSDLDVTGLMKEVTDKGTEKIKKMGADVEVNIAQTGGIGILSESDRHLMFGMTMDLGVAIEGETESSQGYVAGSFVRVHGKVINLYCNADSDAKEDREWVINTLTAWQNAVLSENPALQEAMKEVPESKVTGGGFFGRMGEGAIFGGIAGALVALLLRVFRRKN